MSRKLVLIVIFLIVVGLSYFAYRFLVSNFQQKSVNIVEVEKTAEVNQVRHLVENFGKRLQMVSLQSPDVSQEIQKEYSEFVSPALLKVWMNAPSKAPGRIVSSPWPDRIEITSLTKEEGEKYVINGYVVEITSVEVVNGGAETKEKELLNPHLSAWSKILYLEVLDASFSIDGVIGAFAFTISVPLILLGNGLGALVVREFTVRGINLISKFAYLKNGAMYSIGMLGGLMILESFGKHYPFWLAPTNTFLLLGVFLYLSWRELEKASERNFSKV